MQSAAYVTLDNGVFIVSMPPVQQALHTVTVIIALSPLQLPGSLIFPCHVFLCHVPYVAFPLTKLATS